MARRERILARNRRVPVGALRHPIWLENRVQTAPNDGDVDAGFSFGALTGQPTKVWAEIETRSGRTTFDGVDAERVVSHVVRFRSISGVTAETWIRLSDGTRLDIIQISTLDERGIWMEALCEATGSNTKAVSEQ